MKDRILLILFICSCFGQIVISISQHSQIRALKADLASEKARCAVWQTKAEAAENASAAIADQAQACLDREAKNIEDAGIWREIIEQSQSRDMEDKEKKGVPDDKTRKNLLDSLDDPL